MNVLNSRQAKFAEYYLESGNATESYIKAGYHPKNRDVAKSAASNLLADLKLKDIVYSGGLSDLMLVKKLVDLIDHPDPHVQLRAVFLGLKLKGHLEKTSLESMQPKLLPEPMDPYEERENLPIPILGGRSVRTLDLSLSDKLLD